MGTVRFPCSSSTEAESVSQTRMREQKGMGCTPGGEAGQLVRVAKAQGSSAPARKSAGGRRAPKQVLEAVLIGLLSLMGGKGPLQRGR